MASRSSGWTKSRPDSNVAVASAASAPRIFRNCGERRVRSWTTSYSCAPNCAASAAVRSRSSLSRSAADPSSMSCRARRSASLTALISRMDESRMANGSPRPSAPAAAVAAASGCVSVRPNKKARPTTRAPTSRRVAPQNKRDSFNCRSTRAAGKATPIVQSDQWPRVTAASTSSPSEFVVRTTLPGGCCMRCPGVAVPTMRV